MTGPDTTEGGTEVGDAAPSTGTIAERECFLIDDVLFVLHADKQEACDFFDVGLSTLPRAEAKATIQ